MTISRIFGGVAALALVAGLFAVAPAQASHAEWDLTGTHTINHNYLGTDYPHVVTFTQDSDGTLDGTGTSGGGAYTYDITGGDVNGNTFHYVAEYTTGAVGTTMHVIGTIASDGSISGTWSDDHGGADREGTISAPAGTAEEIEGEVTYTFTGEGRFGPNSKGKPLYTFEVDEDGNLTVVNHSTKPPCVYHVDFDDIEFDGDTATVTDASGKKGNQPCPPIDFVFTENETGDDSIQVNGGTSYNVQDGTFEITSDEVEEEHISTFTAEDSNYYNCATECEDVYATGPISFTYDDDGNVTGGTYTATRNSTTYYNNVTGGTVTGDNVTLMFSRTDPNTYSFSFTGTLVGGMLTGQLDGPYYFSASGSED